MPQLALTMRVPLKEDSRRAPKTECAVKPNPSWPYMLAPQANTAPSEATNIV